MTQLSSFMTVTLDGYYARPDGDLSFMHRPDPEFDAFVADNARPGGTLLFGRVTYQMMAAFWPSPQGKQSAPAVADGMTRSRKLVVSNTLARADWTNTEILRGDVVDAVQKLKREAKENIVMLGSASLVTQLSDSGLIDEYQLVLSPLALGSGRTLFAGMQRELALKLREHRVFSNGNVFLRYTRD